MKHKDEASTRSGRSAGTPAAARQRRARMLGLVAISCGVDIVLLLAFAGVGTIGWQVGALYAAIGIAVIAVFYVALRSGWSERSADPALTREQIIASSALELGFAAYCPPLAFYFLNLLFVVFSFGALRLRLRQAVFYWVLISVAAAAVTHHLGHRFVIPRGTPADELLVALCYASSLLRCTFVGLYGSHIRGLLHERNAQLASASARVTHLANHDELTGALTRRPIRTLLEEQSRRADSVRSSFCIALLDIDHFKSINDRYGHAAGDEVLRVFAATVRTLLRPHDAFARYGGEEFLLILDAGSVEAGRAAVDRIRGAVAALQWPDIASELRVTVSGGLARRAPAESTDLLIRRADAALYEAKSAGRNRVAVARGDRAEPPAGEALHSRG